MIFYFIAQQPYIEKAIGDKFYLTLEDAQESLEFINGILPPYNWQIFQAEAVNICAVAEGR